MADYVPGTLETDPKKLVMSLQQLARTNSGLGGDIATLQGDVTALQGDVTTLQGDVTTLEGSVTTLQGAVNTIDAQIPGTTTDNAAVRFDGTSGTMQNSALLIADSTAALSRNGNGGIAIQGTNTNDSAAAGYVGEYNSSVRDYASRSTLTNGSGADIASISLAAGDYDLTIVCYFEGDGTAAPSYCNASISTTSGTSSGTDGQYGYASVTTVLKYGSVVLSERFTPSSTTTYYLVANSGFAAGTMKSWGKISSRRRR